eukprot:6212313-Pleurochrysis_carterae.AAC.17
MKRALADVSWPPRERASAHAAESQSQMSMRASSSLTRTKGGERESAGGRVTGLAWHELQNVHGHKHRLARGHRRRRRRQDAMSAPAPIQRTSAAAASLKPRDLSQGKRQSVPAASCGYA